MRIQSLLCCLVLHISSATVFAQSSVPTSPYDSRFFASSTQQNAFLNHLKKMLEPSETLASVNRTYRIVKRLAPKDPRVEYALSVTLLKRFEYDKAKQHFKTSRQRQKQAYLPGWQGLIRLHLLQKDRESFLSDTLGLAKALMDPNVEWIDPNSPRQGVIWLGKLWGYLNLPGVDFLSPVDRVTQQTKLRALIPAPLHPQWDQGERQSRQSYQQLVLEVQQKQQETKTQLEHKTNQRTAELKARQDQLDQKQENVRQSNQEWKAWYDEQIKQSTKRMVILQKDYQVMDTAGRRLNGLIAQTQIDIGQLQTRMQLQSNRPESRTRTNRILTADRQFLSLRQQELFRYQMQYGLLQQQAWNTIGKANRLLLLRKQARASYQKATGRNLRKDQTLDRWKSAVKKSSLKTDAKAKNTKPIDAIAKRLTQVSSYFPWDMTTQKNKILQSYQ